jgi:hypothetical protein
LEVETKSGPVDLVTDADRNAQRAVAEVIRSADPDGVVDDTLTVVVGIAGGFVIGLFLTIELLAMTGSSWAFLPGLVAWLGATAYLVRRRTVQGAVAASGYAIAIVLLLIPLVAFSPVATVEGGLGERGSLFLVLAMFVVVPVVVAAAIGFVASRYAPGVGPCGGKLVALTASGRA